MLGYFAGITAVVGLLYCTIGIWFGRFLFCIFGELHYRKSFNIVYQQRCTQTRAKTLVEPPLEIWNRYPCWCTVQAPNTQALAE